ncbi:MAG TPA: helix-turn-helix domain-containing protein [Vicinamibacterales bacterium]|nr:helix-turn-helix domain-containing protein [Vicinamibacterales bacterium]
MRRRREEQHVALATIAEQTKIKLSLLEALERDDVSRWPSGIFRRAYVRAYAHAIGLDPDVVLHEFFEAHPEPPEAADTVPSFVAGGNDVRPNAGPPTRLRYIVGSAIESLSRRRGPAADIPDAGDAPPDVPTDRGPASGSPVSSAAANRNKLGINELVADRRLVSERAAPDIDLLAVADLCTEFSRVGTAGDVQSLLPDVARILDAKGIIIWVWDATSAELRPALVYGYSEEVLAQLPAVTRDADNATAAAFRSAQACAIDGSDHASSALVVPLLTPAGCAGVLAIERQPGSGQAEPVRAVATIFAALLAQLIGDVRPAEETLTTRMRRAHTRR